MSSLIDKLKFWDRNINLTAHISSKEVSVNNPPLLGKQSRPWFYSTIVRGKFVDPISQIERPPTTIHGCPGVKDFLSTGIHMRMWSDLIVKIWPDGKFTYLFPESARYKSLGSHSKTQFGDLYPDGRISIKLENPWEFTCDKSVKFLMTDSHYSTSFFRNNDLWVPPGIIDFSKQTSTNIHVVCPIKKEPYELFFKAGQHLVTYFPLSERAINLDIKVSSEEEMRNLILHASVFQNKYYKSNI